MKNVKVGVSRRCDDSAIHSTHDDYLASLRSAADERGKNPDLYPFNPRLCFYLFVNIQCEARGLAPIK